MVSPEPTEGRGVKYGVPGTRVEFDSVSSALAFLRGDRLIPDSYTRTIGTVDSSSDQVATFELTNHAKRPITILGARSSCGCVVPDDKLPMKFFHKEKRLLTIKIHPALKDGGFFERIVLYTDYPEQREVILVLSGRVNRYTPETRRQEGVSGL
jgi:Protein of unknown function (DUF1573)